MPQELGLLVAGWPALLVAIAIMVAAHVISRALAQHSHKATRLAGDIIFNEAAQTQIEFDEWQVMVEQIAADVLHQPLCVDTFVSTSVHRFGCMRFALNDGRILEFTIIEFTPPDAFVLDPDEMPRQCGRLHAVWRFFNRNSEYPYAIPRDTRWQVRLLQQGDVYGRLE